MNIEVNRPAHELLQEVVDDIYFNHPYMKGGDVAPALFLLSRLLRGYKDYGSVYAGKVDWPRWGLEELGDLLNYSIWNDMETRGELPRKEDVC